MRILKSTFQCLFAIAMIGASLATFAKGQQPFDAKAFQADQDAGRPVLIEIHADWCPTCKAQLPILNKLSSEPRYADIVRMRVDFDTQKELVKRFRASMQSTLVLFKGHKEVARSVGETREANIQAMLDKAL